MAGSISFDFAVWVKGKSIQNIFQHASAHGRYPREQAPSYRHLLRPNRMSSGPISLGTVASTQVGLIVTGPTGTRKPTGVAQRLAKAIGRWLGGASENQWASQDPGRTRYAQGRR